eukprot:TRINITY_DN7910_c0_g1_i4.p1 TRINITY_DN7910_c0_g1~~TRINITY_DN7910_c0_g1_i4.p1  ORF type:complete len:238 (+),score=40.99 TRINITY_DN7910_c0_g1_i4:260-973(+)
MPIWNLWSNDADVPYFALQQFQLRLEAAILEACTSFTSIGDLIPDRCYGSLLTNPFAKTTDIRISKPDNELCLNLYGEVSNIPTIGSYLTAECLGRRCYISGAAHCAFQCPNFVTGWCIPEVQGPSSVSTAALCLKYQEQRLNFTFSYMTLMNRKTVKVQATVWALELPDQDTTTVQNALVVRLPVPGRVTKVTEANESISQFQACGAEAAGTESAEQIARDRSYKNEWKFAEHILK